MVNILLLKTHLYIIGVFHSFTSLFDTEMIYLIYMFSFLALLFSIFLIKNIVQIHSFYKDQSLQLSIF